MPLYDYKCSQCGAEEEVMHSVKEFDNPSPEHLNEISCYCQDVYDEEGNRVPVLMTRNYVAAPAIGTMTKNRVAYDPNAKQKVKADRKKRSDEHFKKEVYPTIPKEDRGHFAKKHNLKT